MEKEVLIIDGGEDISVGLSGVVTKDWKIISRGRLSSGIKALNGNSQIVLLSDNLPDSTPIDALREIKAYFPDSVVITISKEEDYQRFIEEGAFCTLKRPIDARLLKLVIEKAHKFISLKEEIENLRAVKPPKIIHKSPEMIRAVRHMERVSATDDSVFISGEEGTGKELAARYIHAKSKRRGFPFLSISADEFLLKKQSISEQADRGTLYIKGIERLPSVEQESVLNFISSGGQNVRVIAGVIDSGSFDWADIKLPPLRRRKEDIPILAKGFIEETADAFGMPTKSLSKNAEEALLGYDWPGNVSELKEVIRRAFVISGGKAIKKEDILSEGIGSLKDFLEKKLKRYLSEKDLTSINLYETVISEAEKSIIEITLNAVNGNRLKASSVLGISRNTLSAKIKKYRIRD